MVSLRTQTLVCPPGPPYFGTSWLLQLQILNLHKVTFKDGKNWGKKISSCEVVYFFSRKNSFRSLSETSPVVALARHRPGSLLDQSQAKRNGVNPVPVNYLTAWVEAYVS